ncbi:MAG: GtrA family protein [Clostridia bacterium]|nr:GtrA family protein [Clostridia bacterium]
MKDLIKKLINKETVTYIIFGVGSTVVNLAVFKLCDLIFTSLTQANLIQLTNFIAWAAAVAFAFVTNKIWVFESKSWKGSVLKKEIPSFVGARLFSLGVEALGLHVFITVLKFDRFSWNIFGLFTLDGKMMVKIGLAVIVVIMNYVFSKFVIFKNKE